MQQMALADKTYMHCFFVAGEWLTGVLRFFFKFEDFGNFQLSPMEVY